MKNSISIVVLGLLLSTSNAWASDSKVRTSLDNELANGLTVAQTLAEWDNSSSRYRVEPPVAPENQKSQNQTDTNSDSASEKS